MFGVQLYAMALSKDNPEEAEEILNKERQHWVDGEADDKLLLALVELLIYRVTSLSLKQPYEFCVD